MSYGSSGSDSRQIEVQSRPPQKHLLKIVDDLGTIVDIRGVITRKGESDALRPRIGGGWNSVGAGKRRKGRYTTSRGGAQWGGRTRRSCPCFQRCATFER